MDDYKYTTYKKEPFLKFFAENPLNEWNVDNFIQYTYNDTRRQKPQKSLEKTFYKCLNNVIMKDPSVPSDVQQSIIEILKKDNEENNLGQSLVFNGNVNGDVYGTVSSLNKHINNYQQQPQQSQLQTGQSLTSTLTPPTPEQQEQLSPSLSQYEDQEDTIQEFPSEDTIDHHPQRASDYRLERYKIHLSHKIQVSSFQPIRDNEWVINDNFCISDACYQFRNNTAKLLDNPGSFSDLRLLAINHIYLFDKIKDQSVTKYFGDSIHQAFFKQLSLDKYIPGKGKKAFDWCTDLANSPPNNWNTCLSTTATMLLEATESRNLIDTHTSHVLIQILPSFISGPPLSRIEDTLIHHYIAPILQSIFTSDNRFDIEWANSELNSKDSVIYKPDFIVSCFTNRYKILVGEIKAPNSSSTIESDLIKLGKQMKILYNQLVDKHIPDPIACGILIKGFNLSTYMLDLKSPNLYRLINISHITLFQSIDEIYKLPMILSRLLQLKNIITTTTEKTETFAINKFNNSNSLPKFEPPLSWLSNDIYLLSRKRKHSGSS